MSTWVNWLWQREPALVGVVLSVALWNALFGVFAAFNHPLTDAQQKALIGLVTVLAGFGIRAQVSPTPPAKAPGAQV